MTIKFNTLAENIIVSLQNYIYSQFFQPVIHFELEGCYQKPQHIKIDYSQINRKLAGLGIDGEVVAEYWNNQWEYVSLFNGQSPLKEAQNLSRAIYYLPKLFAIQGITTTLIKPVVWAGDNGKLATGCSNIFSSDNRAVHIPNAVQINVSLQDKNGKNLLASGDFGEYLQQKFLQTSQAACLIYLPEEEAFERLALKSKYGLAAELCSPVDISGGHQGSIALYRDIGKHNQKMGVEPLLYDDKNNVIASQENWHKTARIEHRLGASSSQYSPQLNVIYALLNIIDAIDDMKEQRSLTALCDTTNNSYGQLPNSLYDEGSNVGAVTLFANNEWFSDSIDKVLMMHDKKQCATRKLTQLSTGKQLQQEYLKKFQPAEIII